MVVGRGKASPDRLRRDSTERLLERNLLPGQGCSPPGLLQHVLEQGLGFLKGDIVEVDVAIGHSLLGPQERGGRRDPRVSDSDKGPYLPHAKAGSSETPPTIRCLEFQCDSD